MAVQGAVKYVHPAIVAVVIVLMSMGGLAFSPIPAGASQPAPDSAGTVWLCRPGQVDDPCTAPLATTVISSNGSRRIVDYKPAAHPSIDCFYLYPNVSHQTESNANLHIDPQETAIAELQASPFSQDCRVFAPMYRESTGSAVGGTATQATQTAYKSALSAWRDYIGNYNDGRGVVLIGHSEGSYVLTELVTDQIDQSPQTRNLLVSAILTGLDFPVGPFANLTPCESPAQYGCLVDYNAFIGKPPINAQFGKLPAEGGNAVEDICTDPAALTGGSGSLDSMYRIRLATQNVSGSITQGVLASTVSDVSTPWVEYEGGYSGSCVTSGGHHVLAVHASKQVPTLRSFPDASFGLHVDDPNVAMGNLVQLVQSQGAAYLKANSGTLPA
jgi:hypothetical protein